jgi:hypothetical protein
VTRRRIALAALGLVAVLAVLVLIGRWERERHADEENRGIAAVRAAVGPLDSPTLAAYRRLSGFDCLLYRRGANPFALELCSDRQGRVIEAIDRRSGDPEISSLRHEAARATVRVDPDEVLRLLRRMGAPGA